MNKVSDKPNGSSGAVRHDSAPLHLHLAGGVVQVDRQTLLNSTVEEGELYQPTLLCHGVIKMGCNFRQGE